MITFPHSAMLEYGGKVNLTYSTRCHTLQSFCVVGLATVRRDFVGLLSCGLVTPVKTPNNTVVDINKYLWSKHCPGMFQLPMAA